MPMKQAARRAEVVAVAVAVAVVVVGPVKCQSITK
jgi:hypothetical protein